MRAPRPTCAPRPRTSSAAVYCPGSAKAWAITGSALSAPSPKRQRKASGPSPVEAEASNATDVQLASGRAAPTATGRGVRGAGCGGIAKATALPAASNSPSVTSFGLSLPPRMVIAASPPGAVNGASRHSSCPEAGSVCSPKVVTSTISPSAPSKLCSVSAAPSAALKRSSVGSLPSRQRTVGS